MDSDEYEKRLIARSRRMAAIASAGSFLVMLALVAAALAFQLYADFHYVQMLSGWGE